jgi:hypothetical protein
MNAQRHGAHDGHGDQAGLSLPLAGLLRECMKERWSERGIHLSPPGTARR